MGREFKVAPLLPTGKENAVDSKYLAELVGCKSTRELQALIAEERAAGAVILSLGYDGGGYFFPQNDQEVLEFIRTLEARGKNTLLALESARAYLQRDKNGERGD